MTIRLGVVMDPIAAINYKKDSTLAMLCEAEARGYELYYFEQKDLFLNKNIPHATAKLLHVKYDSKAWFSFAGDINLPLSDLDVILMRKDPPFNEDYIYTTYLLEQAERVGALVVNRAQSLRDANEKLFAMYFPECIPDSIVTQSKEKLREFWLKHGDVVCKPLYSMGGASIFRLRNEDTNANVIFDTLTRGGTTFIMAQKFIPEIQQGDKRIIMINGEPVPYALARIPQGNEWRGNLVLGAKGIVQPLTERDLFICNQVGPMLRARGLYFAGLDVIGDYLTEINVTSPTGVRELDTALNINISAQLFDVIEEKIRER